MLLAVPARSHVACVSSPRKAETLRSQVAHEGEESRAIVESTKAQNSPLTEMAFERTYSSLSDSHSATTAAQMDMDNLRHKLRNSQEQGGFINDEIQITFQTCMIN